MYYKREFSQDLKGILEVVDVYFFLDRDILLLPNYNCYTAIRKYNRCSMLIQSICTEDVKILHQLFTCLYCLLNTWSCQID
ncbi:hypothetical protein V1477_004367 [Vespula maculifrons]|uniref:Uncharacterized protein n=1 Tax=Vespula maculifrons TaxID=7453 RepID=A0ABD2CRF2_VESMC